MFFSELKIGILSSKVLKPGQIAVPKHFLGHRDTWLKTSSVQAQPARMSTLDNIFCSYQKKGIQLINNKTKSIDECLDTCVTMF